MHHQEFFTVHTAMVYVIQVCWKLASRISSVLILLASCQQTCMTYTIAVCTVKNSWWCTEELLKTCRVLFQKYEYIWEISASGWFYCMSSSQIVRFTRKGPPTRPSLATLEGGSCTEPEAVVTILCTPDDGCGWHPKHVEWTCRIISRLRCVASHWTIINIDQLCTEP